MDESSLSSLLVLIVLIVVHGYVELAYAAVTHVRNPLLKEQSDKGDRKARRILRLAENHARLNITRQLFLMLVRFAIVAVATVRLADPLIHAQDAAGVFLIPELGYLAVLLPTALITYIFGELVATTLGQAYADRCAPLVTPTLRALVFILSPLGALFTSISQTLMRVAGGNDLVKSVTDEEIMTLVDVGQQGGSIEDGEKEMIYSVLQFGETIAREVMVPRPDMTAVEINEPLITAVKRLIESGHSRIPVYESEIDRIKGLLYAKDVLKVLADANGRPIQRLLRDLLRPAYFIPETKSADSLFKDMQERKVHLAIVVDEYGGTAGVVTIEDLIEEIVGDIKDEYDFDEEAEYTRITDDEYVVDGGMNLDDLNDLLGTGFPKEDNDSIGGYVYSKLGHSPEVGEVIEEPTLLMRVDEVENLRVRKVHITKRTPPEEQPEETKEIKDAKEKTAEGDKDKASADQDTSTPMEASLQPKSAT